MCISFISQLYDVRFHECNFPIFSYLSVLNNLIGACIQNFRKSYIYFDVNIIKHTLFKKFFLQVTVECKYTTTSTVFDTI